MLVRQAHEIEFIKKYYNQLSPTEYSNMILEECKKDNIEFFGFVCDKWEAKNTKIILKCKFGHSWETTIASFYYAKSRCPHCNGNARKSEKERLKQIKEICIKENLTFLGFDSEWRSSSTRFNFLCHCGKTNNMTITNFVNHGARCSSCAKTGYRPIKKGTLYIQKLKGYNKLIGVKFGITNLTTQERMRNQSRVSKFDHEIFYELTLQDGQKILELENKIKEAMKGKTSYISKEDMPDGYTETVAPSELSTIMYIVKTFEKELTA